MRVKALQEMMDLVRLPLARNKVVKGLKSLHNLLSDKGAMYRSDRDLLATTRYIYSMALPLVDLSGIGAKKLPIGSE